MNKNPDKNFFVASKRNHWPLGWVQVVVLSSEGGCRSLASFRERLCLGNLPSWKLLLCSLTVTPSCVRLGMLLASSFPRESAPLFHGPLGAIAVCHPHPTCGPCAGDGYGTCFSGPTALCTLPFADTPLSA